ncbi:MAG TPA: N-acetylglucosamine-6-phosphate deacetylase, partial [Candidatus Binatia bacterium]|nr:N-acetylglucosamine-6-phosphate deacetylase [Candidatus Binatia bacterium]
QQDDTTLGDLILASCRLRAAGCARYLLTLVTDEWPRLLARLRHLRSLRERSAELRHAIAGWHIEGPFLSAEPGYCGAHDPALMLDPAPEHFDQLREIVREDPVLLTIAPERSGAIAAIKHAVALGLKVSLGHTNAPVGLLGQAAEHGAIGFTHLGNGCPRELDRHDNILWRLFETRGLMVSLIPDSTHVSPALFRLIHRELGLEAIYYTTDAMAAAGMKPGRYKLGRLELEVGRDQIVRLPGRPNFAGSALRPIDGIFRAASMLGCSWREVWPRFSEAPAKLMGLPWGLSAGMPADFCLLKVASGNLLLELKVFARGETALPLK